MLFRTVLKPGEGKTGHVVKALLNTRRSGGKGKPTTPN
jgi:hypothetical protein